MDRLAIIGCGGSGKSTLARQLSQRLGIPVTYLDTLYYDTNWATLDPEKFAALQRDLVTRPRWIIDGNYATTMPIRLAAADTVIYLDVPTVTALWGVLGRRLRYGAGQHANGVYDRIHWGFVSFILTFRRQRRPAILDLIAQHATNAQVLILRNHRDVRHWLATLPPSP